MSATAEAQCSVEVGARSGNRWFAGAMGRILFNVPFLCDVSFLLALMLAYTVQMFKMAESGDDGLVAHYRIQNHVPPVRGPAL